MSGAYSDLRKVARSLALASLFDQPAERDMICDLLHLGLELEKIKEIASEPMLAMIRMQWWADLFTSETGPTEAADFAKRLYHHKDLSNDDVLAVIQQTQDSLQSPQAYVAWPQIFHLIVKANGWQIEAQITQTLGQNFAKFYQNDGVFSPLTDQQIKQGSTGRHGFLRLVNLLMIRQEKGANNDDFLLIFRYLFCVLF